MNSELIYAVFAEHKEEFLISIEPRKILLLTVCTYQVVIARLLIEGLRKRELLEQNQL